MKKPPVPSLSNSKYLALEQRIVFKKNTRSYPYEWIAQINALSDEKIRVVLRQYMDTQLRELHVYTPLGRFELTTGTIEEHGLSSAFHKRLDKVKKGEANPLFSVNWGKFPQHRKAEIVYLDLLEQTSRRIKTAVLDPTDLSITATERKSFGNCLKGVTKGLSQHKKDLIKKGKPKRQIPFFRKKIREKEKTGKLSKPTKRLSFTRRK